MSSRSSRTLKADTHLVRVLRVRLKDKHATYLAQLAREVNFVWNFCQEHALKVLEREKRFCSAYDIHPYLAGATKEGLSLHSQTVQAIADEYVIRRRQFKKVKLRWRVSSGPRRSLGWVPFKASAIRYKAGQLWLGRKALSLWDSYGLASYELGAGSISEDARGRWYLNVTVKVAKRAPVVNLSEVKADAVGLDLGLKDFASFSSGAPALDAQRFYRGLEPALARAQRSNNKRRVKALHAKVANRRKDFLHKASTRLVRQHQAIFVGNVNSKALAQGPHAKSVLDAGWSAFRTQLQYKCDDAGVWFKEVDERFSTQRCSSCGARTGPKGREELSVRAWVCSACGAAHQRDVNAARNILAAGLAWLENEFAKAPEARACESVLNESAGPQGPSALAPGHGRPEVGIPVL